MKWKKWMRYMFHSVIQWWRQMDARKRRYMLSGVVCLVVGIILGNVVGQTVGAKQADEQWNEEITQVEKDKQKEIEKLETSLEELQTKLHTEQNPPKVEDLPWYLTLVNEEYPMEENYVPKLTEIEPGYSVDSRIAEPLRKMLEDAEKAGLNVIICSAYRSVERQEQVFNDSVQDRLNSGMNYWEACQDTMLSVAMPGTSEHGLGMAVDLISNQYTELDEKQAQTKEAKWLAENCHKYGFILRYPLDKTDETGIIFEPWHYRYVGVEDATKIMEANVTLETYLQEYE